MEILRACEIFALGLCFYVATFFFFQYELSWTLWEWLCSDTGLPLGQQLCCSSGLCPGSQEGKGKSSSTGSTTVGTLVTVRLWFKVGASFVFVLYLCGEGWRAAGPNLSSTTLSWMSTMSSWAWFTWLWIRRNFVMLKKVWHVLCIVLIYTKEMSDWGYSRWES